MKPEISVIVPVYNIESYLSTCLDSILNQTINRDLVEILLIDDGSTDRSGEICDKYAEENENIIVFHKENGGLSSARNYGIERARGSFLTFIDSDDAIVTNYLEILYLIIKKYHADIASVISISTKEISKVTFSSGTLGSHERLLSKRNAMISALVRDELGISAWAYMYRSELFKDIRYPKGKLYEDLFTTPYLIDKADNGIAVINAKQYLYRNRPNSITHNRITESDMVWFEGMAKLQTFLSNNYGTELNNALQCRYLTDFISVLCNRVIFEENYVQKIKSFKKKGLPLWNSYLKNKYLPRRFKAQLFTLTLSPRLYKWIVKLYFMSKRS